VDAEIAGRRLATKNPRHADRLVLSVVEFFHSESGFLVTPSRHRLTAHHKVFATRHLTIPASTLIRKISASEVRHKTHQVIKT